MSAPVDVLDVMDRYSGVFLPNDGLDGEDLAEARAAVAELIAAADEAGMRLSLAMEHTEDLVAHMRLCAALARCTGAQP